MAAKRDSLTRRDGQAYSPLYRQIWDVVARIPRGRVATYGQVAALAGRPGQPRLVGYALKSLPDGASVPWHRVINARGEISLRAGVLELGEESIQQVLLRREGIRFDSSRRLDLSRYQWRPTGARGSGRSETCPPQRTNRRAPGRP